MATRKQINTTQPAAKKVAAKQAPKVAAAPKVTPEVDPTNVVVDGETGGEVIDNAPEVKINLGVGGDASVQVNSAEMVTAIVPVAFDLTLDNGKPVRYESGTQEMPLSHATHWYSRARGVTIYQPKK